VTTIEPHRHAAMLPAGDTPHPSSGVRLLFVAFLAMTLVHIGYVVAHEPFSYDAWNLVRDTQGAPITLERFFAYWGDQYLHANPRFGQVFMYLAYKTVWFAPIATPLVFAALAAALVTLGTGRLPSWSRGRDLLLVVVALGFAWFALPSVGMIMFCRAYGTNYLFGAVIQLWFLVPLRLGYGRTAEASWPASIGFALLGVIAGACNEHTGPTLCLFATGYAAWRHRAGIPSRLSRAGALGAAVGFALLFFAPGQGERYSSLAHKMTLAGRVAQHGISGNLDIFRELLVSVAPVLALLVCVLAIGSTDGTLTEEVRAARRSALARFAGVLGAGVLIAATIFASPKLGARFYLASAALVLAGFIGIADQILTTGRRLAPFVLLALVAGGYAGWRTIPLFTRLDADSDARLATLAAAPEGSVVTADAWEQVDDTWWFLGDDFRYYDKRDIVTKYYGLGGVVFRGVDLDAPLGVSDVRLVPRYDLVPASCLDEHGGLELPSYKGTSVLSIQSAFVEALAALRARLPAGSELRRLDLEVQFSGAPPPLPRPKILVARWQANHLEAWVAEIERHGRATTREIIVPPDLAKSANKAIDIYIYQVGGEARRLGAATDRDLIYVPWKAGTYWALACRPDECFVIAATRHGT
jgi:hypothetical protein